MLVRHRGHDPAVDPSAFVAPTATLVGDVRVGPRARVMYGAVLDAEASRVEVGECAQPLVHRPQRVRRPPELAEQQRDRNQTDPDPDEDEAEDRVCQQILAGHHRHRGPAEDGEDDQPSREPKASAVDKRGQPGERHANDQPESRPPPREDQDDKGDRQRERGAHDDEGERQREVVPGRDAV